MVGIVPKKGWVNSIVSKDTVLVAAADNAGSKGKKTSSVGVKVSATAPVAEIPLTFGERMLGGAVARGVAQTVLHPVDVMRTRLQARGITSKLELSTFLKGVIPQVVLAVPAGAMQFLAFEIAKEQLAKLDKDNKYGTLRQIGAGAFGATCAASFRVPQEVCKQRIQADIYPNFATAISEIMKKDGPLGFYKGWLVTLSRDVPWNTLAFLFHHEAKKAFTKVTKREPSNQENLMLASVAGMVSAIIMTPIDVAKTRIMTQRATDTVKYSGILNTLTRIATEEGFTALFKGVVPRALYLAPLAGITLSVYEAIAKILRAKKLKASSKSKSDQELMESMAKHGKVARGSSSAICKYRNQIA